MDKQSIKRWHYTAIGFFVAMLLLNYISAFGWVLPYTQQEISDMHLNLLAPAGFTFSIWGIIYIGMAVVLAIPFFMKLKQNTQRFYYGEMIPLFILWNIFNILWTLTWNSDWIFTGLIMIVLYTLTLLFMVKRLSNRPDIARSFKWTLTLPIGLHAGWLTFATFTNVMTWFVKIGMDGLSFFGALFAILFMIVATTCVLFLFMQFNNWALTVPALWALFGIIMKQRPGSEFINSNGFVMFIALVLFVGTLALHFMILQKNRRRGY